MSRAKLVDHYINRSREPGFEIDQIRKELAAHQIDEEEIKVIVRLVDNELQSRALRKSSNKKSGELVWFGAVLALVGALITVGTFTGFLPMEDSFLLVYGPFFGGLSMLLAGLAQRKK